MESGDRMHPETPYMTGPTAVLMTAVTTSARAFSATGLPRPRLLFFFLMIRPPPKPPLFPYTPLFRSAPPRRALRPRPRRDPPDAGPDDVRPRHRRRVGDHRGRSRLLHDGGHPAGGPARERARADRRGARPLRRDESHERQEAGPRRRPRARARRAAGHAGRAPRRARPLGVGLPLRRLAAAPAGPDVLPAVRQPVRCPPLRAAAPHPPPRRAEEP